MPKHHRTHIASAESFLRESETAYRPQPQDTVKPWGPSCPWPMQSGDDGPIVDLIEDEPLFRNWRYRP